MAEKIEIARPVQIESDSKERVAFELMQHIAAWEDASEDRKRDKKYWLSLYLQCIKATNDYPLESILKEQ